MDEKLDLILQKLGELDVIKQELQDVKSQLDENTQLTKAIHHRQEETDAKLENLILDVHKIHGEIVFTKEAVADIKEDVEYTYQKTSKNELEIFKLRKEQTE